MSRISIENVAISIRKVRAMNLAQRESLADEIYLHQPNMLGFCLAQPGLGVSMVDVEFLIDIFFVCYQSMMESGLHWPVFTMDEIERQVNRWVGAVDFSDRMPDEAAMEMAQRQYIGQHPEQPLLAYVLNETNQWMQERSRRNAAAESDKYVTMAALSWVNCIAWAKIQQN